MQQEKKLLPLGEAVQFCGCEVDRLLEAASEGGLGAFAIARDWQVSGGTGSFSGYLRLPNEALLLARGHDHVLVKGGESVADDKPVSFAQRHEVPLGVIYFSREDAEKLRDALRVKPSGPKAERNLERTIAGLAHALAESDPKRFTRTGKLNAEAVAEVVYNVLDAKGLVDHGLSARSIQGRILDALKKLEI